MGRIIDGDGDQLWVGGLANGIEILIDPRAPADVAKYPLFEADNHGAAVGTSRSVFGFDDSGQGEAGDAVQAHADNNVFAGRGQIWRRKRFARFRTRGLTGKTGEDQEKQ